MSNCRNLCAIKKEVCAEAALTAETTTTFSFTIDQYGNLDITDPDTHFGAAYSPGEGNLSGTGSLIDRFWMDPYKNLKFNNNS